MQDLKTLIDKAAKVCGGMNALARELGITSGSLGNMKAGRTAVSPITAAFLADIANEDVNEAIHAAMMGSAEGTRFEYRLGEILGKGAAAGGAADSQKYYSGRLNIQNECDAGSVENCEIATGRFNYAIIVLSRLDPRKLLTAFAATAHRGGFFMPDLRTFPIRLAREA
ncbi:hypothetical protein PSQ39_21645 [Curvibacter sp. HBC28]|uniref:XRE family transcriptional regulator n=1 Tax=Curvibacter microcysteis TaxID=3026419 RepID=A0ABT5MKZ0_9BURK|nr:hypothetical protein [Curvibacter sp. HBC28]MDD0817253.1 hypothetical protein [Curvibacter sp. HBC28]